MNTATTGQNENKKNPAVDFFQNFSVKALSGAKIFNIE